MEMNFARYGGEKMGKILRHYHGTTGTEAEDLPGLLKKLHRVKDLLVVCKLDGLVDRLTGKPAHLLGAALGSVRIGLGVLKGQGRGRTSAGKLYLEGVEALELEVAAEAADGGLGGAAFVGKLGDGHELYLRMLGQHVVGHLAYGGSELIIG